MDSNPNFNMVIAMLQNLENKITNSDAHMMNLAERVAGTEVGVTNIVGRLDKLNGSIPKLHGEVNNIWKHLADRDHACPIVEDLGAKFKTTLEKIDERLVPLEEKKVADDAVEAQEQRWKVRLQPAVYALITVALVIIALHVVPITSWFSKTPLQH